MTTTIKKVTINMYLSSEECLSVIHFSLERFIRSTSRLAGLSGRKKGSAVLNLVQFVHVTCSIFQISHGEADVKKTEVSTVQQLAVVMRRRRLTSLADAGFLLFSKNWR